MSNGTAVAKISLAIDSLFTKPVFSWMLSVTSDTVESVVVAQQDCLILKDLYLTRSTTPSGERLRD